MTGLLLELSTRAKSLSPDERALLAEMLLESIEEAIPAEFAAEWEREIGKRVAAYEQGAITYTAEEVFAEARRIAQ